MLYLRECPKCQGDMYLEKDHYGSFRQCLQCGMIKDLDVPVATVAQAAEAMAVPGRRRGRPRKIVAIA